MTTKAPHPWLDFEVGAVCDSVQELWRGIKEKIYVVEVVYHHADGLRSDTENVRAHCPAQAAEYGFIHFNSKNYRGVQVSSVRLADPFGDLGITCHARAS